MDKCNGWRGIITVWGCWVKNSTEPSLTLHPLHIITLVHIGLPHCQRLVLRDDEIMYTWRTSGKRVHTHTLALAPTHTQTHTWGDPGLCGGMYIGHLTGLSYATSSAQYIFLCKDLAVFLAWRHSILFLWLWCIQSSWTRAYFTWDQGGGWVKVDLLINQHQSVYTS